MAQTTGQPRRTYCYPLVFTLWLSGCSSPTDAPSPQGPGAETSEDHGATSQDTDTTINDDPDTLPSDPDELRAACDAQNGVLTLGRTKLRRLTQVQLRRTLNDLVQVDLDLTRLLAPDEKMGPFDNNSITSITNLLVDQHQAIAKRVTSELLPRRDEIVGCKLESEGCASEFIDRFGGQAFRRPLHADEHAAFSALYELGASDGDVENGFRLVMEVFLQSPSFIYLVDSTASDRPSSSATAIDPYSLASRLSYFLWNSMPDTALFAAVKDGTLQTPEGLDAQVTRMLADTKADATIAIFHQQWLGIDKLPDKTKDASAFPLYSPDVATAMLNEVGAFSNYVIRTGDGLLSTLLTAQYAFPDSSLLPFYEVSIPADFSPGDMLSLDGTIRSGLLTSLGFLSTQSHTLRTSPVHRGLTVRKSLLCQTVDPPPPGVNNVLPEPAPGSEATSTRELIEIHTQDVVCAECHTRMDPLGVAFENFDAVGSYRTHDGELVVDASGRFVSTGDDLQGEYENVREMAIRLAQAGEVQDCVANQWFRFALGRTEALDDACSLIEIHDAFRASGGNIAQLLSHIVRSDAFTHVRSSGEQL